MKLGEGGFEKEPTRKPRVVAIIQARMGSTRLPGKVLAEAAGKPLIVHMLNRLDQCKSLDEVVVATPNAYGPINEALERYGIHTGQYWWKGDEDDVLSRVLEAARTYKADVVVELTADCPLVDPRIVDEAVERFLMAQDTKPPLALVSTSRPSFHPRNQRYAFPPGMDVRIFSTRTLEQVDRLTQDPVDREHVSLYIWEHQRKFWCHDYLAPPELQDDIRLTVDTPEDLELVRKIFEHFAPRNDFSLEEVLKFVRFRPELRFINAEVEQKAVR